MRYFDAHAHLQLNEFDTDRDQVLDRMRNTETGAVMVGVDLETSRQAVHLAEQYDFLWAAVGLHPNDNPREQFDVVAFTELARHPRVVAIGECGLDYFRSGGTPEEREAQLHRFDLQIALAAEVRKPLIIHCRNAHEDMIARLTTARREYGNDLAIIIHFCTVSGDIAQQYLDLGCYLSFPGPVTFTDMYNDSIRLTPFDRMLVETDSPFAAPAPMRGRRNEPSYVVYVSDKIAKIHDVPEERVRNAVLQNVHTLFGILCS